MPSDVVSVILFLMELNFVTINVTAPSLPVFFEKTSTEGLHFVPGEAMRTKGGSMAKYQGDIYVLSSRMKQSKRDDTKLSAKMDNETSTSKRRGDEKVRRTSFDSDAILVRRSVEIKWESDVERSVRVPT